METMQHDPMYIAEKVKAARRIFRFTQDNLATASGLTERTIQKIESGRHRPEEQTLRSLARAFGVSVKYFEKPTPEEEAQERASIARAIRKTVIVPTSPIRTASEFMSAVGHRHAFRFNTSSVNSDEALEIATRLVDFITDLMDVWNDCPMSNQLEWAKSFVEDCSQLENLGFRCHIGNHRQLLRNKGQRDLVVSVGIMSFLPKQRDDGTRYAIVHLEGEWESVEEDRPPMPPEFAS